LESDETTKYARGISKYLVSGADKNGKWKTMVPIQSRLEYVGELPIRESYYRAMKDPSFLFTSIMDMVDDGEIGVEMDPKHGMVVDLYGFSGVRELHYKNHSKFTLNELLEDISFLSNLSIVATHPRIEDRLNALETCAEDPEKACDGQLGVHFYGHPLPLSSDLLRELGYCLKYKKMQPSFFNTFREAIADFLDEGVYCFPLERNASYFSSCFAVFEDEKVITLRPWWQPPSEKESRVQLSVFFVGGDGKLVDKSVDLLMNKKLKPKQIRGVLSNVLRKWDWSAFVTNGYEPLLEAVIEKNIDAYLVLV
ncbi:MAG: hypothetical protein D6698_16400, partial [Gammaproteobacteria bacterium]